MPTLTMAAPKSSAEVVTLKQNFQQAEIETVIEAVAKLTGRNFIIDPRVKGKVTLIAPGAMHPEDLYETLLAILRVHGFVAVPGKTAIQIVPANLARDQVPYDNSSAEESDWVTEVIPVHKVDATKLVAVLRPLVAREGHLVALSDSNRLILTDSLINIQRIKAILKRVDIDESEGFEVVALNHASASELVQVVKKMLPKIDSSQLTISFDERTNQIILSGVKEKRREVRALIADLDVSVPSEGRVQVVYLHYAKAKDLVPVLQKMAVNRSLLNSATAEKAAADAGATNQPKADTPQTATSVNQLDDKTIKSRISIEAEERVNAVVISAPPAVVTALKQVIKQLDIRRAQVLIEAILVEVSETRQADLGIDWGAVGPNGVGMLDLSGAIPAFLSNIGNPLGQAAGLKRGMNLFAGEVGASGNGWGALLRALDSDTGANILSTPTLLTLDNEEAEIVVGQEVPFQTGSYTSTGTTGAAGVPTNPFNTIERKNVGLSLKVKPQINEGNEVFLEIDQEISNVLPRGEAVDVQTSKRQIKTSVMVGNGNIIVLGGLLTERETEVESKIPLLGDIPGLGALFRSSSSQREKVNLMVFLRPVIVRNSELSSYYSRLKYSKMQAAQQEVLKKDHSLINGLRPKMRSEQEWHDSAPVIPQASTQPEPEKSSVPSHLKAFEDL